MVVVVELLVISGIGALGFLLAVTVTKILKKGEEGLEEES